MLPKRLLSSIYIINLETSGVPWALLYFNFLSNYVFWAGTHENQVSLDPRIYV